MGAAGIVLYRFKKPWLLRLIRLIDAIGERLLRVTRPFEGYKSKRVLLVKLNHMGDAMTLWVMAQALRDQTPGIKVDVLVRPSVAPLCHDCEWIDHVWVMNPFEAPRGGESQVKIREVRDMIQQLSAQDYDVVVDCRGDIRVALMLRFVTARCRIGAADGGGGFCFDYAMVPDRQANFMIQDLSLLSPLGIGSEEWHRYLKLPKKLLKKVPKPPEKDDRVGIIFPGAGRIEKRLTAHDLNAIDLALLPEVDRWMMVGHQSEGAWIKALSSQVKAFGDVSVVLDETIPELVGQVMQADVMICADSFAMHVAGFLQRSMYAVFKGENADVWCPYTGGII